MKKKRNISVLIPIFLLAVLLIGVPILRNIAASLETDGVYFTLVYIIYIGFSLAWGISTLNRLTDRHVRIHMAAIVGMMVFFYLVRTIKYSIVDEVGTVSRYLWYLYYIPTLFMPLFSYWISLYIGRPEGYRPVKYHLYTIFVTVVLLGFILTNDLHRLAFVFPPSVPEVEWNAEYTHGILYYLTVVWIVFLAGAAIFHMYSRGKKYGSVKCLIAPFSVLLAAGFYSLIYMQLMEELSLILEMSVMTCLTVVGVWEACIRTNLLPSNKDYHAYFSKSAIGVQIYDKKGRSAYASGAARELTAMQFEMLLQAKSLKTDDDTELILHQIDGGYAVSEHNTHEISGILEQLLETQEEIKDASEAVSRSIQLEASLQQSLIQTRLYDTIPRKLDKQLLWMEQTLAGMEQLDDDEYERKMRRVILVGVYVKRCSNLILLSEQKDVPATDELRFSFVETFRHLQLAGRNASYLFSVKTQMTIKQAILCYDFLNTAIFANPEENDDICVIMAESENEYTLTIQIASGQPFTFLSEEELAALGASVESDEDAFSLVLAKEVGA